jgi:hypothetical protein
MGEIKAVPSVAGLKALVGHNDGDLARVRDTKDWYEYDAASEDADDDFRTLKPDNRRTTQPGRWIRQSEEDVVAAYAGGGSFQVFAGDLELAAAAGSDDGTDPKFLAGVMGNLLGADVDGEGNYLGGVIGALSVTGLVTDYPSGGILGVIMDGVTDADGAVVAVLDGSDPSAVTRARAMFACRVLNNNEGSGVDFGLDLYAEPSEHYSDTETETPQGLNVEIAEIRLSNGLYIMSGTVDPSAGDGIEAPVGSLYLRTNGEHWRKTGAGDTQWTENGDA